MAFGARAVSVTSPVTLFADLTLPKKYGVYCVLANGHSCSARHSFLPITKSLTGVPEATTAQRISRAKQSIKASGVPFGLPSPAERAQRLPAVLHVLYLIFNEGYASSVGMRLRLDLAREVIRLARGVKALLPEDAEVAGLLALMLLTDARRAARTGPDEELIP
ncbi:MAG TPA: DUF6596 domain-containing protein [Edaphobacter sp.]|nr:DUF6596 domain-containing protein [Edaphobacter sp.]